MIRLTLLHWLWRASARVTAWASTEYLRACFRAAARGEVVVLLDVTGAPVHPLGPEDVNEWSLGMALGSGGGRAEA